MTYENWKIGKGGSVVTDVKKGFDHTTGHLETKYYGGVLICESIWREKDRHIIASAYKMLEALENLENDNGQIPKHAWDLVQNAIKSARNK